jgi:hypothetical protein
VWAGRAGGVSRVERAALTALTPRGIYLSCKN